MIFPWWQQRLLMDAIEETLKLEAPELVAMFAIFERLTRDEGPPPHE